LRSATGDRQQGFIGVPLPEFLFAFPSIRQIRLAADVWRYSIGMPKSNCLPFNSLILKKNYASSSYLMPSFF
jgi:hypothetical protein